MDKSCPICYEFLIGRKWIKLNCSHDFCFNCLQTFGNFNKLNIGDNFSCPVCRKLCKWSFDKENCKIQRGTGLEIDENYEEDCIEDVLITNQTGSNEIIPCNNRLSTLVTSVCFNKNYIPNFSITFPFLFSTDRKFWFNT